MKFYIAPNSSKWSEKYPEQWFSEIRMGELSTPDGVAYAIFDGRIEAPKHVWLVDTEAETIIDQVKEIAKLVRSLFAKHGFPSAGFLTQWLYTNDAAYISEENYNENVRNYRRDF